MVEGKVVVTGYLTMTIPALGSNGKDFYIPKFVQFGDSLVCNAEKNGEEPAPLWSFLYSDEAQPWKQSTPPEKGKDKQLYLISEEENKKHFYALKASGVMAMKIHRNLKKGDCVVVEGFLSGNILTVTQIGRYLKVSAKLDKKIQ